MQILHSTSNLGLVRLSVQSNKLPCRSYKIKRNILFSVTENNLFGPTAIWRKTVHHQANTAIQPIFFNGCITVATRRVAIFEAVTCAANQVRSAESGATGQTDRSLANFRAFPKVCQSFFFPCSFARPDWSSKQAQKRVLFVLKDTWTHDFFRLGNYRQMQVPSQADQFQLQNAGLVFNHGDQSIAFVKKFSRIYLS